MVSIAAKGRVFLSFYKQVLDGKLTLVGIFIMVSKPREVSDISKKEEEVLAFVRNLKGSQ